MEIRRFAGKVAIVTGAGGTGTGGVVAKRLAEEGAQVVASDVDEVGLEALSKITVPGDGEIVTYSADVSKLEDVEALVGFTASRFGRLDVMANHAGIATVGRVTETAPADWHKVIAVTLDSVYHGARAAIPYLAETKGSIVNTASICGMGGDFALAAYNAAKAGVINLTRALAIDHASDGIRANCVSPAAILYESNRTRFEPVSEEYFELVPLKRYATPQDIASAITYLASDDASYITGHNLVVDGGVTAQSGQLQLVRAWERSGIDVGATRGGKRGT